MDEQYRQPDQQSSKNEPHSGHLNVPVAHSAQSAANGPEGTEHGNNPATLHHPSRWARFKNWFLKITVAEAGMLLLTLAIAISSVVYTKYAKRQWKVMREQLPELQKAADAAKSAANTAASQLELTERPWVSIKDAHVVSPLVFNSSGAHVTFEFVLRNSGPSPAIDVSLSPRLYLLPSHEDVAPAVERLCNNKIPQGQSLHGLTLFPGIDTPQRMEVMLDKEEMANSAKQHGGVIVITPIVCIAYRPTFKAEAQYYSGIQYPLWPTIWPEKMQPGSSIPINKLPLQRNGFFGEIAQ